MLDSETKRRIDSLRDILVSKISSPEGQVEQITIGLMYKFMNDMDKQNAKPSYFAGRFKKYAWHKLIDKSLEGGGTERVRLYSEGIEMMKDNEKLPKVFRDMFKNSYLPFNEPQTVNMFLTELDHFDYSNSEKLGDAYEYLLSFMGSQGNIGQFRTPRHIIDFMVEVVDPKLDEKILDPACGTAGFLISSYKHILKNNSKISYDAKKKLMNNLIGYDIEFRMIRISLVNMYLHQFTTPQIYEYDTLSDDSRWNEHYHVILANPPFFSPKGGIKPHQRFGVHSTRAEVLFVDYIASHLYAESGRAAIIVPEGIIFQTGTAYRKLRKDLVENSLVGVVSLPAGIFQPYSGVKTSILILNKKLARTTKKIFFAKVENDGYSLGAQRTPIDKNDLPAVVEALKRGEGSGSPAVVWVDRGAVADKDYILSANSYALQKEIKTHYDMVALGDVCELYQPKTITQKDLVEDGEYLVFGANGVIGKYDKYNHEFPEVLITCRGNTCGTVNLSAPFSWITGNAMVCSLKDTKKVNKKYLYFLLRDADLSPVITGSAQPQITRTSLQSFPLPLPPIGVQEEIVAEVEGYQKMVDGCRMVVSNYKPTITIDPAWKMLELGDVCEKITDGTHKTPKYTEEGVPFLRVTDITKTSDTKKFISEAEHKELIKRCRPEKGDVLYSKNGTIGVAMLVDWDYEFSIFVSLCLLKPNKKIIMPSYLSSMMNSIHVYRQALNFTKSGTVSNLHLVEIKKIKIPIPPREEQEEIVRAIEEQQVVIDGNKRLLEIFQQKIHATIARVWGA